MTVPEENSRVGVLAVIGRAFAGVIAAAAGIVFLLCAWQALSSRFWASREDLHGYGLIFGVFLAIVAAFIAAIVLPLVFPRQRRSRLYAVTLASFGVAFILLIALLVTA
jgi:hypothetical protein